MSEAAVLCNTTDMHSRDSPCHLVLLQHCLSWLGKTPEVLNLTQLPPNCMLLTCSSSTLSKHDRVDCEATVGQLEAGLGIRHAEVKHTTQSNILIVACVVECIWSHSYLRNGNHDP